MTAKVPTIDIGIASDGIAVAERLRRNRKITITTRARVTTRVNLTSCTESRIDSERSKSTCSDTEPGRLRCRPATAVLTRSVTSTVLAPGWRWTASMMLRSEPLNQAATRGFSTPSTTRPSASRRTGLPSTKATMIGR